MKKLTYLFLALLIVACSSDDSSDGSGGNDCENFNVNTPQWTLPKPNLDPSCLE